MKATGRGTSCGRSNRLLANLVQLGDDRATQTLQLGITFAKMVVHPGKCPTRTGKSLARVIDARGDPTPYFAAQFFVEWLHDGRDGLPQQKDLAGLSRPGLSTENSIDRLELDMLAGFARAALLGEPR